MRKRGVALVTVLMVIGILATITAAVITMGTGTLKTSFQNLQSEKALYAADAAGKLALVELANSASWPGLPLQNFGSGPEQIQVDIFASGSTTGITPLGVKAIASMNRVLRSVELCPYPGKIFFDPMFRPLPGVSRSSLWERAWNWGIAISSFFANLPIITFSSLTLLSSVGPNGR